MFVYVYRRIDGGKRIGYANNTMSEVMSDVEALDVWVELIY